MERKTFLLGFVLRENEGDGSSLIRSMKIIPTKILARGTKQRQKHYFSCIAGLTSFRYYNSRFFCVFIFFRFLIIGILERQFSLETAVLDSLGYARWCSFYFISHFFRVLFFFWIVKSLVARWHELRVSVVRKEKCRKVMLFLIVRLIARLFINAFRFCPVFRS